MTPIQTSNGYLVLITRGAEGSLRTTHRKRRGTRCSIRRYQFVFPSIDKEPALHVDRAYGYADGDNATILQGAGIRRQSFYAFVANPGKARAIITGFPTSVEAEGIIRNARQEREEAEWAAAAP